MLRPPAVVAHLLEADEASSSEASSSVPGQFRTRDLIGLAMRPPERLSRGSTADYAKWKTKFSERRRRTDQIRIANNTWAILRGEGTDYEHIAVKLHQTDVITFFPNGSFRVNSGGWQTRTTLERINRYLPGDWRIYTHKNTWYWAHTANREGSVYNDNPQGRVLQPYSDGDTVNEEGFLQAREQPIKMKARRTRASRQ